VGITTDSANPMTGHTIRVTPLIMTAGAADDVIASRSSVKVNRARIIPTGRVRILWVCTVAGQVLQIVARHAEFRTVAPLAERFISPSLDRMPAQVVRSVNEVSIHVLGKHHLDREWNGPRVTVLAKILVVTLKTRGGGRASYPGVVSGKIPLV